MCNLCLIKEIYDNFRKYCNCLFRRYILNFKNQSRSFWINYIGKCSVKYFAMIEIWKRNKNVVTFGNSPLSVVTIDFESDFSLLGVADGVGGWRAYGIDPGEFSMHLMKTCERLIKLGRFTPSNPSELLARSYYELLHHKKSILGRCIIREHIRILQKFAIIYEIFYYYTFFYKHFQVHSNEW